MTAETLIAAAYAAGWDAETPSVTGAEAYLADAAINGEFFDALRPHLVEAYRQTLAEKSTFAEYNLRKMQCMIKGLDPERSK